LPSTSYERLLAGATSISALYVWRVIQEQSGIAAGVGKPQAYHCRLSRQSLKEIERDMDSAPSNPSDVE